MNKFEDFRPKIDGKTEEEYSKNLQEIIRKDFVPEDMELLAIVSQTFDERLQKSKLSGNNTVQALADTMTSLFLELELIDKEKKLGKKQRVLLDRYGETFHNLEIERKRLLKEKSKDENEELVNNIRENLKSFVTDMQKTFN
jgi:hypothetical protein